MNILNSLRSRIQSYRNVSKASPWVLRYVQLMEEWGVSYTIDDDNKTARVAIPSPKVWAEWQNRSLDLRSILKILSGCRIFAYHSKTGDRQEPFLEFDSATQGKYTFMKCNQLTFQNEINQGEKHPDLFVDVSLAYIGESSVGTYSNLVDADNNVYYSNYSTVVLVDKYTRQKIKFPNWWIEKYKPVNENKIPFNKLVKDPYCFQHHLVVSDYDVDEYGHTNFSSYIVFCEEALKHALQSEMFSFLKGVKLRRNKFNVLYIEETLHDQALTVNVWENESNERELNFHIERDNELVCQVVLTFI